MNSFGSRSVLRVGKREYEIYRLDVLEKQGCATKHLPYSLRILLENLLRREDGKAVKADDVRALTSWKPKAVPDREIAFMPSRVLLQDFTGVPAVVDLAAMRDAMKALGGDPKLINPLQPAELVIDHSVQVDEFGTSQALQLNAELEFQRNQERYAFLRWGQTAFKNFAIVPPDTGIVHQINLEYLARVVFVGADGKTGKPLAYPDTLVGTDSHTTMINGLGILGWGVGGIEAEAAMLGQPISMLIPQVVGFRIKGKLREGSTATDLVLTVTEMLRKKGVVGKFVEFFGPGLHNLPLADRATISNMAPEYGATCGIFPVDEETLRYLRLSGRDKELVSLVEAYYKEQGLFFTPETPEAEYSDTLELDLSTVEPCIAGPKRPQDRVTLSHAAKSFEEALPSLLKPGQHVPPKQEARWEGEGGHPAGMDSQQGSLEEHVKLDQALNHGSVVIAAITSCTNTSNPSVLVAAGLLAKKAVEKGLTVPAWVKTSLAPGSMVVTEYLTRSGLLPYLEKLKFHVVGYGCTTCIGNSGPLPQEVSDIVLQKELVVASVLSGNRNFEGRINSEVRANYLMSPPLVVAYALAGSMEVDLYKQPLGYGHNGHRGPVYLKDIWPTAEEVDAGRPEVHHRRPVPTRLSGCVQGRRALARPERSRGRDLRVGPALHLRQASPVLREHAGKAGAREGHLRRAGAVLSRQQCHHRSHLAGWFHQAQQSGRAVPDRARREAGGLQLLRLAARQPRSDDARHVRQRAPAQQADASARGRIYASPAGWRRDVDL